MYKHLSVYRAGCAHNMHMLKYVGSPQAKIFKFTCENDNFELIFLLFLKIFRVDFVLLDEFFDPTRTPKKKIFLSGLNRKICENSYKKLRKIYKSCEKSAKVAKSCEVAKLPKSCIWLRKVAFGCEKLQKLRSQLFRIPACLSMT